MKRRTFFRLVALLPWCKLPEVKQPEVKIPVKPTVVDKWYFTSNVGFQWRGLLWSDGSRTFTCLETHGVKV